MSFNSKMHPRNIYKNNKPQFKLLASKHEKFKEAVKYDCKGRIRVDFKDAGCLRALTCALLKEDFNLDVEIPLSRLIPTVPLRLNYILWIEDIFAGENMSSLKGIDIGTGASCIYPLLGASKNGWNFIATEADPLNHSHAVLNVKNNHLAHKIQVLKVDSTSTIEDVLFEGNIQANNLNDQTKNENNNHKNNINNNNKNNDINNNNKMLNNNSRVDFCMVNPPFFESSSEAWGVHNSRSSERPSAKGVRTASEMESVCEGGEVAFVQRVLIEPSLRLRERVRIYTTMLGKKSSVKSVLHLLKQHKVSNTSTTELCQGSTMRWCVAWTFMSSFSFSTAESNQVQSAKHHPALTLTTNFHTFARLINFFLDVLSDLKLYTRRMGDDTWEVTAYKNTWSHQRRLKRKWNKSEKGFEKIIKIEEDVEKIIKSEEDVETIIKSEEDNEKIIKSEDKEKMSWEKIESNSIENKYDKNQHHNKETESKANTEFILKWELRVSGDVLEFHWVAGDRDSLHQIYQHFKNKLAEKMAIKRL